MPDNIKEELKTHYSDKLPEYQRNDLLAKLNVEHQPNLLAKAKEFIIAVDNARNISYNDYIPKIAKFI